MNTEKLVHYVSAIATVLLASTLVLITTSDVTPAPSSPVPGGCADSVISFSPCLPFISAPPNDLADEPAPQCCDIFNGAFASGEAECLCYLIRQNSLLGFPLNATKLISLSDLCLVNNSQSSRGNNTNASLEFICSGSSVLPPLISTRKPRPGSNGRRAPPLRRPPPSPPSPPTSANRSSKHPIRKPPPPPKRRRNNGDHLAPSIAIASMPIYLGFFV